MKRLLILLPLSAFVLVPALIIAAIAFTARSSERSDIGGLSNR